VAGLASAEQHPFAKEFRDFTGAKLHLPGIVTNKTFWRQGYSEPNAGSDLAQLRTRAIGEGDHYVVNGSKICDCASLAHFRMSVRATNPLCEVECR
jgi:hypothetical protein